MIMQTSDSRQLVATQDSATLLKLALHRVAFAVDAASVSIARCNQAHADLQAHATPMHRPTPQECYGCVDWFHY